MADEKADDHVSRATGTENAQPKTKTTGGTKEQGMSAQKSKLRKEQSKAELEAAIRKRVDCEEKAFRIVERLLDNPVDQDFFINCAQYIDPSHYADVTVERAIINQCGYPVCNNKLPKKMLKQQFHIDTKHNKVYDITERKNFCSNWCYKASQFYQTQLSTSPVWGREKEPPPRVRLLQRENTEERSQRNVEETSCQDAGVRISKLSVSNNVLEQDGVVDKDEKKTSSQRISDKDRTMEDILVDEGEIKGLKAASNGEEKQLHTQTRRTQQDIGMNKMPTEEGREGVLQTEAVMQDKHVTSVPVQQGKAVEHVSAAQAVFRSLMELRTEATFKFLYGDHVEVNLDLPEVLRFTTQEELRAAAGVQLQQDAPSQHHGNNHHGNNHHDNKDMSQKLSEQRFVTAEKSKKVRFEDDQKDFSQPLSIRIPEDPCQGDEEVQLGSVQGKDPKISQDQHLYQGGPDLDPCDLTPATRPLPDLATLQQDAALFQMKVQEFYRGSCQLPVTKDEDLEVKETKAEENERPVILPPVDSQSQRALQQKILLDRLNRVFPSVLAPLGLSVRDFSTELNLLVKTFRLTSDNIVFRPAELKLLAVVLIHILATKVPVILQRLYCPQTAQLLTSQLQPLRLDLQDLDALVSVCRLG